MDIGRFGNDFESFSFIKISCEEFRNEKSRQIAIPSIFFNFFIFFSSNTNSFLLIGFIIVPVKSILSLTSILFLLSTRGWGAST